jgi:hypothetical protein
VGISEDVTFELSSARRTQPNSDLGKSISGRRNRKFQRNMRGTGIAGV